MSCDVYRTITHFEFVVDWKMRVDKSKTLKKLITFADDLRKF